MIITRDTFEKFKDAYVHALAITLKESSSYCPNQKDDYLWNKLNELYQEPICEEELDKLAETYIKEEYNDNLCLMDRNNIKHDFKSGYRKAMGE